VLAGSLLVFLISHTFTRPLDTLVAGVRALGQGNFSYPLEPHGGDEVAEVTGAFDRMRTSLQSTQRELLDAERLATIGRMASSISHDLRHSLAAVMANAEFLCESDLSPGQREDLYAEITVAVKQMTDLIESLLEFSRTRESLHPSHGDVREAVESAIKALKSGQIDVGLRRNGESLEIRISDNGPGIAEAVRDKLFEPFVSYGKENGTGMGLTVVQKILQDHGGDVVVERTSPEGTTFRLNVPLSPSPENAMAAKHVT
jgi:signal transduction histidine kinase